MHDNKEEDLRQSEERYRLMFKGIQEAFIVHEVITDKAGKITDLRFVEVNPVAEKVIGRPAGEVLGRLRSEVLGSSDPQLLEVARRVFHNHETVTMERYVAATDRWFMIHSYSPQPGQMATLSLDITTKKKLESQAQEKSEWLQFLNTAMNRLSKINNLHDGLEEILSTSMELLRTPKGNVQLCDALKPVLMIAAQKGFKKEFLDHFREVSATSNSACGMAFSKKEQVVINDVAKDPHFAPHLQIALNAGFRSVQSTPLFDRNGLPIAMVSTHAPEPGHFTGQDLQRMELYARYAESFLDRIRDHDAIERMNLSLEEKVKQRTSELSEALKSEKELNEMKSRFVTIASHEFRTPLSAILSSAYILEQYNGSEQQEKRNKHVNRIKSSVNILTDILNDFLSLEKLEQGKVAAERTTFNLETLLEDIIDEMRIVCKEGQSVLLSYTGKKKVLLDMKILRNIIINLLSNSIKYSDKAIQLTAVLTPEELTVTVKDEGIGIPVSEQQKISGKFYRASNVNNTQGTGLGLNIVYRYVELLDGVISFTSKENQGTSFKVTLPVRRETAE